MKSSDYRSDLPIILLYDLNPSWSQADRLDREAGVQYLMDSVRRVGHPVEALCVQSADLETVLAGYHPDEFLVLNWCEELPGLPHSEYLAAQKLEQMGYAFTGSGSCALALSQDKPQVKRILQQKRIPVPKWSVYYSETDADWEIFPAIVKSACEHCSMGISRESVVETKAELAQRIRFILKDMNQPALVEEFIDGREFHVGVIGNGLPHMLPPAEIDFSIFPDIHDRLCTYEANFDKNSPAYYLTLPKLPVAFQEDELSFMEQQVIGAYQAIGCRDYGRMDVRLKDGVFYVLDVNPNPDISPETSLVLAAELVGYSYGSLGSKFVNLAARRHPRFGIS